ncbi:TraX family protein [Pseudomonas aeruginosa]|nr:conjugal transfer protein TraX [Pseudomonas aeruginosa]
MASMLLDHLRYLWPDSDWLFIVGRLAFPFFCLALACNVARSLAGQFFTDANVRYLGWLMAFSILSEVPYRWLAGASPTANVMPTLMLGLIVAWGVHHRTHESLLATGVTLLLALAIQRHLMFGFFGVLLPACFLAALYRPGVSWLLPAVACLLANSRNRWLLETGGEPFSLLILLASFGAPMLGLYLLRSPIHSRIWPVRRWGYYFYPLHLTLIHLIRLV